MAFRMMKRSCLSVASLARWTDFSYLVAAMPARIMTIAMTIMISSSVNPTVQKPRRAGEMCRRGFRRLKTVGQKGFMRELPVRIFRPVDGYRLGLRINIEHIVAAPACGICVVLHGAQTPFSLSGHRVHRNFSEIAHLGGCVRRSLASGAS